MNEKLDFEAKLTGYIYPHATGDNSLEAAVTACYTITGVRYNNDLVLEEHYLEAGVYHDLSDAFRTKLRAGVLHHDKPPATSTDKEAHPWDIQLSLTYTLNPMSLFSADYSYQENERSNFAVGYTASF